MSLDVFGNSKYRLLFRFWTRPVLPFAVQLAILGPLILAPDRVSAGYAVALPWLLPLMLAVNLPFLSAAFRAFRMDIATKRNHALEHATILLLERRIGKRFSGRALPIGFRVCGPASHAEVRAAFDHVCQTVRNGEPLSYVSWRCGSNAVTALGMATVSLAVLTGVSVILRPPWAFRAAAMAAMLIGFVGLRRGLGNAVQRRFFMAVDFTHVAPRAIRGARQGVLDRHPVTFVETQVRAARR